MRGILRMGGGNKINECLKSVWYTLTKQTVIFKVSDCMHVNADYFGV